MMKIIAAGFQHETNTFAATRATLDEFELADAWPGLLRGEEVRPGLKGMNIPLAGFIDAVDADEAAQIALTPLSGRRRNRLPLSAMKRLNISPRSFSTVLQPRGRLTASILICTARW